MSKLEFKGTKGEWVAKRNDYFFEVKPKGSEEQIELSINIHLNRWNDDEGKFITASLSEENEANAKLIAAAPDLLKAVEYWLDYRDNYPRQASIAVHQKRLEEMANLFESARNKALK